MNLKSISFLAACLIAIVLSHTSSVHCSEDGESSTESEDGNTDVTVPQEQSETTKNQPREDITEDYFEFLTNGGEDDDILKEAPLKDGNNAKEDIAPNNEGLESSDNEGGLESIDSNAPNEEQIETVEAEDKDSEETNIFDIMANSSKRVDILGLDPMDVINKDTQVEIDVLYGGTESETVNRCFMSFDVDKNDSLNLDEFDRLLKRLFKNKEDNAYYMDEVKRKTIFDIFDKSGDETINKDEFAYCWTSWIKKIVRPISAFLIIDVQNDFITGSLATKNGPAGEDGAEVVDPINQLLEMIPFDAYAYSMDWHPENHISFFDNLNLRQLDPQHSPKWKPEDVNVYDEVVFKGQRPIKQVLWPKHCVQNTSGAELHKDLKVHPLASIIKKGVKPDVDSYSAFSDPNKLVTTELEDILRSKSVTDVYVCGLATDYCVGYTALDAQDLGFRTIVVEDCCRGIDPDKIKSRKKSITEHNGAIVQSNEVMNMVIGQDRRPELGYQLAKDLIYNYSNKVKVRALPFGHWYPKGRRISHPENYQHYK